MQKVLIIAETSQTQERLRSLLDFDESILIATANFRQVNSINLKKIRQAVDLIVLEDESHLDEQWEGNRLSLLKRIGLPIILLPQIEAKFPSEVEPLVLNLSEGSLSQPGLASLISKIKACFLSQTEEPFQFSRGPVNSAVSPIKNPEACSATISGPPVAAAFPVQPSKLTAGLNAIARIAKQLREPLSNMNLAIHMLGQVQSPEERDRYLKLLREEYQRELQLVNELESLQANLQSLL